jgi:hypothetical protein
MRIYIDEAGLFVPPNPPRSLFSLVRHHEPGSGFIQLGPGGDTPMLGHAKKVCQALHVRAKGMIVAERNRHAGKALT